VPGFALRAFKTRPCLLLALGALLPAARADESVVNSAHDLSCRGPGPIRAVHETEVCIFCHTPHNAEPQTPLWNRENPQRHYRIYESSTTEARIDQPSGPSKLCLSCHDGTMALGNLLSRPATEPVVMTSRTIRPGPNDLTTDLSDDHPIGFRYDRALSNIDPQIRDPGVVSHSLPLGAHDEMQCTTCHDPHDNELGDFLRITDRYSAICVTCHDMYGWEYSSHAISPMRTPGRRVDRTELLKYRTVRDNGCASCHVIHSAPHPERLLRARFEEENCLNCHDGLVAVLNIASEIGKRSAHRVNLTNEVHKPDEDPFFMLAHVECADCHNPHAARPSVIQNVAGTRGQVVHGPNVAVSGVSLAGLPVERSTFEYEICFKCHSEGILRLRPPSTRQIEQSNTRLEFQLTNPSFHPVAGPRRNPDVVSLIAPLNQGSVISCVDCHNSDNARSEGGSGANGPHGSQYEPILVRNYDTADFTTESAQAYALCYKCHSRESILGDDSFPYHRLHVVGTRAPCSACHDAHGIYRGQGSALHNSSLINFDLAIVNPFSSGGVSRLEYTDTGQYSGNCTLICHGMPHLNFSYGQGAAAPRPATGVPGSRRLR
jgi:predicted CXXCH cytochrome family protein